MDNKKGGPVRYVKDRETICLTEEQTRHICKKVELGSEINIVTTKQEIDNEKLTVTKDNRGGINKSLSKREVLNNIYKDKTRTAQMEY